MVLEADVGLYLFSNKLLFLVSHKFQKQKGSRFSQHIRSLKAFFLMLSQMLGQSESKSCSYTAGTNGTKFFVHLCIQRRYEGYLGWHLRSSDKMDIEPDGVEIVTNGKSEM